LIFLVSMTHSWVHFSPECLTILVVTFSPCGLPSLWPRPRSHGAQGGWEAFAITAGAILYLLRQTAITQTWRTQFAYLATVWQQDQGAGNGHGRCCGRGTDRGRSRGHTSEADATPWPLAARPTIARFFGHFVAILFCIYLALLLPFYAVTFQRWLRWRQNPFYLYAKYVNLRPAGAKPPSAFPFFPGKAKGKYRRSSKQVAYLYFMHSIAYLWATTRLNVCW